MNNKANNIIRIQTSIDGNFFRYWLEFLRPFHKLTDREIDVTTAFLQKRYNLSKVIKDAAIIYKVTLQRKGYGRQCYQRTNKGQYQAQAAKLV